MGIVGQDINRPSFDLSEHSRMKVFEFKAFLLQLASMHDEARDSAQAKALRKLAELFDGAAEQKVTTFAAQIRAARGL